MKRSEIYFGRNILKEALAAKASVSTIFVETKSAYEFVQSLPKLKEIKNLQIEEGIPKDLKHEAHQGIAFRASYNFYDEPNLEKLSDYRFIILCNHVEDVHNLGSIARCAAAFGAKLIVHEEKKSASVTAGVVKASAGCVFKLKFWKVESLQSLVKPLKKRGFSIAGLDATKESVSLYDWKPNFPLALILGSEGDGIESSLKSECDSIIKIPMDAAVESLNVSHAAGLAMSWARQFRKRDA